MEILSAVVVASLCGDLSVDEHCVYTPDKVNPCRIELVTPVGSIAGDSCGLVFVIPDEIVFVAKNSTITRTDKIVNNDVVQVSLTRGSSNE